MTVVANATGSQQGKMLACDAHFDKSAQPALSRHAPHGQPARAFARTRSRLTPPPSAASIVALTIAACAPRSP